MASILRQIVAGPRSKHQETGLDLCYVTSNVIATSGPSQTYPQLAYRNPLSRLVAFLDAQHGKGWAIWEFRAEGTGYPDDAVYNRIRHFPWPDHHPPPFGLVPRIVGGMKRWLEGGVLEGVVDDDGETENGEEEKKKRVVVVHCKAGKGRSGTMACSYLIAECGWKPEDALARFTERRMRPGFGAGVSIPSQLRWISYVDRWAKGGKKYVDRPIEIVEIHVWGLRNGVKMAVEGFAEEGKKIRVMHTFKGEERIVVQPGAPGGGGVLDFVQDMAGYGAGEVAGSAGEVAEDADYEGIKKGGDDEQAEGESEGDGKVKFGETPTRTSSKKLKGSRTANLIRKLSTKKPSSPKKLEGLGKLSSKSKTIALPDPSKPSSSDTSVPETTTTEQPNSLSTTNLQQTTNTFLSDPSEPGGQAVIFKPTAPIAIPNSDVNISVERRNKASMGLTMVTAVAHVWFNTFFEGRGPEQDGKADTSGVFEIDWDKMDGIKGSSRRGARALDRLSVVWRVAGTGETGVSAAAGEGAAGEPVLVKIPSGVVINEPGVDSPVPQVKAANWKGDNHEDPAADKHLGLRVEDPESRSVSKASSLKSQEVGKGDEEAGDGEGKKDVEVTSMEGVKVSGPMGEDVLDEAPGKEDKGKKDDAIL
ncbi:hypothetical protein B0J18DRAFT_391979 [Chaetomium sp. MPI-SDFR-AT-0129]|nr:hypothetical protein B0J18DRAFT_391979 [Chaetomium sp. MPI-SDFR-AT-0129]